MAGTNLFTAIEFMVIEVGWAGVGEFAVLMFTGWFFEGWAKYVLYIITGKSDELALIFISMAVVQLATFFGGKLTAM